VCSENPQREEDSPVSSLFFFPAGPIRVPALPGWIPLQSAPGMAVPPLLTPVERGIQFIGKSDWCIVHPRTLRSIP
jgi:hypothetical protein